MRRRGAVSRLLVACAAAGLLAVPSGLAHPQDAVIAITSGPSGETVARETLFAFAPGRVGFAYATCQLDSGAETRCASPITYDRLELGAHRFVVRAYSGRGQLLGSDSRPWTIVAQAPPPPPQPPFPPPAGPVAPGPQPTPPDFFLAPAPYTSSPKSLPKPVPTVVLKPGAKAPALIAVVRIGGSKGGFSYSFSGVPAGITAAIGQDNVSNPTVVSAYLFASFSAKPMAGKITLTAKPSSPAVGKGPRSILIRYLVAEEYDLAVAGIDVTQGIQLPQSVPSTLPARDPAKPTSAVSYPGAVNLKFTQINTVAFKLEPLSGAAPLVRRKTTKVSVFAVVVGPVTIPTIQGATALLHGRAKDGTPLPSSPLKSSNAPTLFIGAQNEVPLAALTAKKGAFTFTLPETWIDRDWLELEAELLPPDLYGKAECSLQACAQNNHFRLTNIPFYDTGYLDVWPLGFISLKQGDPALGEPYKVFKQTRKALPIADDQLRTGGEYRAFYIATTVNEKTMLSTVKAFVSDLPAACKDYLALVRPTYCPDLVAGVRAGGIAGKSAKGENVYPPRPGITIVNEYRPLTSVAHEVGHALGFKHTDTWCGGNSDGQVSEYWWPDPWGLLYGITSAGWVNGAGNVGTTGSKGESSVYDYMSYCANNNPDDDSWLSLINYRRAFDGLRELQKLRSGSLAMRAAAAPPSAVLSVIGYVEGDGVVVTRVRPKAGEPDVGPPDSPYRLVLRDAVGRVVAEAPMRMEESMSHGPATVFVSADVLLPDTPANSLPQALYAVEIVTEGRALARVARSRNAPAVQLLAPRAGARVGGGQPVTIRWSARDADGDSLTAALDYSTDDGASWRTVAGGVAGPEATLPSRLLTASRRARIRVRVSDGLNETAVSARFVSRGAPPLVRITAPERRITIGTTEALSLEAQAYDDSFQPLKGRALTWFDGRKRIAFGTATSVAPLAPGPHRIRVVARDHTGRTGSASVRVRVRAVAPRLIVRAVPAHLSSGATVLRLRLATTIPAVVTATGRSVRGRPHWALGTRVRAISIPVTRGSGPIRLALRATAFGRTSTLRLTVPR